MVTMADVRFQLRLLGFNGVSLRRGEVRELPSLLRNDEVIEQAVYGSYEKGFGMLVATDQRLLFVDRRFFHRHFSDIPYECINSVELDTGLFTSSVTVYARPGEVCLGGLLPKRARNFFDYLDRRIEHQTTARSQSYF